MSAFMCDDSLFQDLAQALPFDYTKCRGQDLVSAIVSGGKVIRVVGPDGARLVNQIDTTNAMIADWMKANRMAVNSRYRANDPVPEPVVYRDELAWVSTRAAKCAPGHNVSGAPNIPRLLAIHKHLICLQYQCSEDVPAEHLAWHNAIQNEIDYATKLVSYAIISELPEWDDLNWGKSGVRELARTLT